jgi:hypothetical protein
VGLIHIIHIIHMMYLGAGGLSELIRDVASTVTGDLAASGDLVWRWIRRFGDSENCGLFICYMCYMCICVICVYMYSGALIGLFIAVGRIHRVVLHEVPPEGPPVPAFLELASLE